MALKPRKFKYYYRKHKDKIYTYFYYRVNFSRAQAEDLTSEVFIKALKAFAGFDQARSFQAWIFRIARNHLINHYRVMNREVELDLILEVPDESLRMMEITLECEEVIKAIRNLKPYHRDVLLMRFVDGLTNDEIAEVLGKDQGAVRTQVSRAREALKLACQD